MRWNSDYVAGYYATIVDPLTWADKERFEINEGSYVSRVRSGIRENAELHTDFAFSNEELVRVYMDAAQGQNIAHTALFTGYATSPTKSYNGRLLEQNTPCYGILKHAQDILLPLGWYASAGRRAIDVIKELLTDVRIDVGAESPSLTNYIVAENNESNLSMVDKILNAIGWVMRVDGMGVVMLSPKPQKAKLIVSPGYDMVEEQVEIEQDVFSVPNVFRAVYDESSAIAVDNDPNSPYSVKSRGREIWEQEDVSDLADNESLALYANRKLKELQYAGRTARYARRFYPELYVDDIIGFDYDEIAGAFRITSQKIDLSHNCRTDETGEAI